MKNNIGDMDLRDQPGKREHILFAASKLFSERGFSNVSIRDICEQSDVTPPTVYYYFGNKERLFEEVIFLNLSLKEFQDRLLQKVSQQQDPQKKLVVFVEHFLTDFPREFFNPGMFLQTTTELYSVSANRVMDEFRMIHATANQIFQEGMDSGLFKKMDSLDITLFFMNVLTAYILSEEHFYQSFDPVQTAPFITDVILHGIIK